MATSIWFWVGFNAVMLLLLAVDLGIFHRKAHVVSVREAAAWTGVWLVLSLTFCAWIWQRAGDQAALEFLTGYLVEWSLAVDNIFVFVLLFSFFAVPEIYQHRVLFWGILGALVMRGAFIAAGAYVLERWSWVIYIFGALLVVTGIRMLLKREQEADLAENRVVRFAQRALPLTAKYHGQKFVLRD